jgi:Glyoxalase-like domain
MTSKFTELAIDCADPSGLARFWCSVLDYEVQDEDDGLVRIEVGFESPVGTTPIRGSAPPGVRSTRQMRHQPGATAQRMRFSPYCQSVPISANPAARSAATCWIRSTDSEP